MANLAVVFHPLPVGWTLALFVAIAVVAFVLGWSECRRYNEPRWRSLKSERDAARQKAELWSRLASDAIDQVPVLNECRACGFEQIGSRTEKQWVCARCGRDNVR